MFQLVSTYAHIERSIIRPERNEESLKWIADCVYLYE